MNIVIIHPTSPGQFEYLIPFLARDPALRLAVVCRKLSQSLPSNVRVMTYQVDMEDASAIEGCAREAAAVSIALKKLEAAEGFVPDVIVGHTGWGSMMYVKAFYPSARVVGYFEWYCSMMPEMDGAWFLDRSPLEARLYNTQKNAPLLSQLESCDVRFTPTQWQRERFPARYQADLQVVHEGVDTEFFSPAREGERPVLPQVGESKEIVTYVARGLEPTRCFPLFMDAVRLLLPRRPNCHVMIAGGEKTYYGSKPPQGKTWKQIEIEKGGFDPERVHFLGWLSREDYRDLLRASTVHAYLTLPYVLSWSLVQAMSAGCCLVSSATPPVEEVMQDGANGLLTVLDSPARIAERIEEALTDSQLRERVGRAARETILERYRLEDCLRKQRSLLLGD